MRTIKRWDDQHRLCNLTQAEVNALLGETNLSPTGHIIALERARAKLRTAEMIILVKSDEAMAEGPPPERR